MITIIHGTDTATSRKFFMDEKEKHADSLFINGQTANLTDLAQVFEGGELFVERKNFFIEQLLGKKSRKKKDAELDAIINYINKNAAENNIVIWEEIELTKTTLNLFKNPTIKMFKLPQALFQFLESVKPENAKLTIPLFHETIKYLDVEMVYFMIVRQVRLLLALVHPAGVHSAARRVEDQISSRLHLRGTEAESRVRLLDRGGGRLQQSESHDSSGVDNPIDEIKRIAPWQKQKLQNQANSFEIGELKKLYNNLFEIEKDMKTGNLSTSLSSTIDFLLLEI